MSDNVFTSGAMSGTYDQWEYDRQQNIIDEIEAGMGPSTSDTADAETAEKLRFEARAVQYYLVRKNTTSEEVTEAVRASDEAWVAANPPPAE